MTEIGKLLERIELESGMPRAELMRRAGLSYAAWISWKRGDRRPSVESLRAVQAVLQETGEGQQRLAASLSAFC
jgi:transcriptional regulator with XRE-family HTH domain